MLTHYLNGDDAYAAGQHRGVDIGAPLGSRVVAAEAGTVTFAGVVGSSGLTVSERTADGRFDLSYLHLSRASVRIGERLAPGAAIGAVGTSGRRSVEAPHLHFGVREAGQRSSYRDPMDFLGPPPADEAPKPAPTPVPVGAPAAPEPASAQPAGAPFGPAVAPGPTSLPLPSGLTSAAPPLSFVPAHGPHPAASRRGWVLAGEPHPAAVRPHAARGVGRLVRLGDAPRPRGDGSSRHHRTVQGPGRGPATVPQLADSGSVRPSVGPRHKHGGIDLGWLAACIGLVIAATLLAHPDHALKVARRGRYGLGALLRSAPRRAAHARARSVPAETRQ